MALPATDSFTGDANPIGGNWTTITSHGNMRKIGGKLVANTTDTQCGAYWNADTFAADHYNQLVLTDAPDSTHSCSIGVRCQSGANTQYIWHMNNNQTMYKLVAGSLSAIGSAYGLTISAGDTVKLTVTGANPATLTPYVNGVAQATRTDNDIDSGGAPSVRMYCPNNTNEMEADDWEGGDVTAATAKAYYYQQSQ